MPTPIARPASRPGPTRIFPCNARPSPLRCRIPVAHRVRHASNGEHLDRNCGGIRIIWDRGSRHVRAVALRTAGNLCRHRVDQRQVGADTGGNSANCIVSSHMTRVGSDHAMRTWPSTARLVLGSCMGGHDRPRMNRPRDYADASDAMLLSWSASGDGRAFDQMVIRYGPFALRIALRLIPDPPVAEDVAQEAMMRAWFRCVTSIHAAPASRHGSTG